MGKFRPEAPLLPKQCVTQTGSSWALLDAIMPGVVGNGWGRED